MGGGGRYPDVIIELTSPTTSGKDKGSNLRLYAEVFGVEEYYWYDPDRDELGGYRLVGGVYEPIVGADGGYLWSEQLGVYIGVWEGAYAGRRCRWVRWVRADGSLVPTPLELAEQERLRAEQERQRAEAARVEAEHERQRAERLAQKLRELGMTPEE